MTVLSSHFTIYDDAYNHDWNKCQEYIKDKAVLTYEVLKLLLPRKVYTQSFIANIILDKLEAEPVGFLRKNIRTLDEALDVRDIGYSATIVIEGKYFVNIRLNNARIAASPIVMGTPVRDSDCENKLLMTVEVNDVEQFNEVNDYKSSSEVTTELLTILSSVIIKSCDRLCETGVFAL